MPTHPNSAKSNDLPVAAARICLPCPLRCSPTWFHKRPIGSPSYTPTKAIPCCCAKRAHVLADTMAHACDCLRGHALQRLRFVIHTTTEIPHHCTLASCGSARRVCGRLCSVLLLAGDLRCFLVCRANFTHSEESESGNLLQGVPHLVLPLGQTQGVIHSDMALLRHGRGVEARGTDRSNGANDRVTARNLLLQLVLHKIILVVTAASVGLAVIATYRYDIKGHPLLQELGKIALKFFQVRLEPLLLPVC